MAAVTDIEGLHIPTTLVVVLTGVDLVHAENSHSN